MTAAVRRRRWRGGAWILSTGGRGSGASLLVTGGGAQRRSEALDLGRRRCRSLVSLEPWVSSPSSGVVGFLPVERTWVGQGYPENDAVQMTNSISLGQLGPWFSGPGKQRGSPRETLQPNEAISTLHMDKGPIKTYTGSKIESFFVKQVCY